MTPRHLCALAAFLAVCASPVSAQVHIENPGQFVVALPAGPASELSGISYVGGDDFVAVSDNGGDLFPIEIIVDPATAQVESITIGAGVALAGGGDIEGVAYDDTTGTVLVSNESGPAIREHQISDGALLGTVAVPSVFGQYRSNLSLESLTLENGGGVLWTANEEALTVDGPVSDFTTGTVVRLQRFDEALQPDGQWAYLTDPIPGSPFFGKERSGVSDLMALENGDLLVLERSFSSQLFRTRIYLVDFTGATDTSTLASLASDPYTPVAKTLLFETPSGANFEGMTLGALLPEGDRSLFLISDDGGGASHSLYPLRLSLVPEPSFGVLLGSGVLGLAALGRTRPEGRRARRGGSSRGHSG